MPAKVKKIRGKYRVVHNGKVMLTKNGKPRDGGGHNSARDAYAQASAINAK